MLNALKRAIVKPGRCHLTSDFVADIQQLGFYLELNNLTQSKEAWLAVSENFLMLLFWCTFVLHVCASFWSSFYFLKPNFFLLHDGELKKTPSL